MCAAVGICNQGGAGRNGCFITSDTKEDRIRWRTDGIRSLTRCEVTGRSGHLPTCAKAAVKQCQQHPQSIGWTKTHPRVFGSLPVYPWLLPGHLGAKRQTCAGQSRPGTAPLEVGGGAAGLVLRRSARSNQGLCNALRMWHSTGPMWLRGPRAACFLGGMPAEWRTGIRAAGGIHARRPLVIGHVAAAD